ncbi:MAG TPA: bifunctional DNA-binding transcriptional regulator/O6-methylguanine-DNA methyltransferase Ada [Actinomycetes bacterium]|nr:bifunctional DNA-binding transcriptional regulator/O6-methylguanine-DNA methyltransferase Ada [Actinomycetes bacterium]
MTVEPPATAADIEPVPFAGDEERWAALVRRAAEADGVFYFSVRTTGVYCRPSCPARRPLRRNVAFHATCEDAERAGFRPCKRCRPDQPALSEQRAAAVAKACRMIEADEGIPSLEELAAAVGMSKFHFHRVFKAVTGITPSAYAAALRAQRTRDALARSDSVTDAIYQAGFSSSGRFYAGSWELLGMTPTSFRSGGTGVSIRFAVGECSLGSILVAATGKGICSIAFGDDPHALVRELQDRFPKADLIGADSEFERVVATVVGLVEAPGRGLDLPLDVRGTAFQRQVWQVLREIPAGSTVSYADIASRIGAPTAVRAVARACASNPVAVAIPCHRIVRKDGSLSGYRWGVDRKRALLEREAAHASGGPLVPR